MVGEVASPTWLATDALLAQFGKTRFEARSRYKDFVSAGIGADSVWAGSRQQIYLARTDSFLLFVLKDCGQAS